MAYRIQYLDHGGNIYATEQVEHDDEQAMIRELRQRQEHRIGAGFDVWDGDRLVYRHRKS